MRNFSDDADRKMISLYHIREGMRVDRVPIKNQNYVDYLYGKDGRIEDALGQMEVVASEVITDILADDKLPERLSEGFSALHAFVLFQLGRTPAAVKEINDQVDKLLKEMARDEPELRDSLDEVRFEFTDAPAELMRTVAETYPFTVDLKWKLLLNYTDRLFITSDHPAILYNQFLEKRKRFGSNIGLSSKGLQIFFPIGPRHLIVMYDEGVYRIGGRKHLESTIEVQEADVIALNLLQAANADELLFFNPLTDADHVTAAANSGRAFHVEDKSAVKRYHATGGKRGDIIHSSRVELRVDLELPCAVIQSSAAGPQLSNAAVQLRDPEFVQICEDFLASVKRGRYTIGQFGDYMKDRWAGIV